ncbi:hypothetical protein [Actinacidiphila sp. bgisy160]|uniref:hypothetical protein n=1 Tax=Actinacidiphila sp. bgisy160 TaxID=3413796 RepID=UPI003D74B36D
MDSRSGTHGTIDVHQAAPRRRHGAKLGIPAVVVLAVAAHLGLGGLLLTSGPWKHWALGAVLAVVVFKVAFLLLRRGKARKARKVTERVPHAS